MSLVTQAELRRLWEANGQAEKFSTEAELNRALDAESTRIDDQIEELAFRLRRTELDEYRQTHGQDPEYMDLVGIHSRTRAKAQEIIFHNEVHEEMDQIQQFQNAVEDELLNENRLLDPKDRWKDFTQVFNDLDRDSEILATELWTDKDSALFQVLGERLIYQRIQDGDPVPIDRNDPLTQKLEALIQEEVDVVNARRALKNL